MQGTSDKLLLALVLILVAFGVVMVYSTSGLHAEEQANALFDKKLAQEEVWIRQGIKARRTRNEGRVRALQTMRDTLTHLVGHCPASDDPDCPILKRLAAGEDDAG